MSCLHRWGVEHRMRSFMSGFVGWQTTKQHPRFYAQTLPCYIGSTVELDPDEAKHAVRVLRLRPGDGVELCDGQGQLAKGKISQADKSSALVTLTDAPKIIPWEGPEWVVAVGCLTLKGGRTDWLVEKCTELGARAVIPLITQRSQTANKNKFKTSVGSKSSGVPDDYNAGRLERLAVAATKQSLRVHGLQLHPPTALNDVLPALSSASVSLLATAGAPPVLHQLQQRAASRKSWHQQPSYLLVGPEGDFTPEEIQQLMEAGALPVGLGSNRLRTETAAVALLATARMWSELNC
eukprot:jgi/Chrzof1/1247/Cz01g46070.t1